MFRNKWARGPASAAATRTRSIRCRPHSCFMLLRNHACLRSSSAMDRSSAPMVIFYIIVSLWFHFYRYKYVRRGDQFTIAVAKTARLLIHPESAPWSARSSGSPRSSRRFLFSAAQVSARARATAA